MAPKAPNFDPVKAGNNFIEAITNTLHQRKADLFRDGIQSLALSVNIDPQRIAFDLRINQETPAMSLTSSTREFISPSFVLDLVLLPQLSGNGYYSYSPVQNQYGTQSTIDALIRIGAAWRDNPSTGGVELGIGDISLQGGGPFPPHSAHQKGIEADIRPMRNDRQHLGVDWRSTDYDQAFTQSLVDTIRADANCEKILFNDPKISGVQPYPNHDNHLHVKFVS